MRNTQQRLLFILVGLRGILADIYLPEELVLPEGKFPLKHQEKKRNIDLMPLPAHRPREITERQDTITLPHRTAIPLHHTRDGRLVPLVMRHRHDLPGIEVEIRFWMCRLSPPLFPALFLLRRLQLLDELIERDRRALPQVLPPKAALDLPLQALDRLAPAARLEIKLDIDKEIILIIQGRLFIPAIVPPIEVLRLQA